MLETGDGNDAAPMPSTSVSIHCRFERRQGGTACIPDERAAHPTQEAVGFIGRLGGREV